MHDKGCPISEQLVNQQTGLQKLQIMSGAARKA